MSHVTTRKLPGRSLPRKPPRPRRRRLPRARPLPLRERPRRLPPNLLPSRLPSRHLAPNERFVVFPSALEDLTNNWNRLLLASERGLARCFSGYHRLHLTTFLADPWTWSRIISPLAFLVSYSQCTWYSLGAIDFVLFILTSLISPYPYAYYES